MGSIRVEIVRLGRGPNYEGGGWENTFENPLPSQAFNGTTANTDMDEGDAFVVGPTVYGYKRGHARIICDVNTYVAIGPVFADLSASTLGTLVLGGVDTVLPVNAGDFITATTVV